MPIRYKNNGKYAYKTRNVWNKEKKKYQTKWTYLGVVTPTGEYKKIHENKVKQEKLILNYGDTYLLNKYCEKSQLKTLIQNVFGNLTNNILALTFYKLLEQSAMQHAQTWIEGNYAKILYPDANLSTQKISNTLKSLGNERLNREFFKQYLQKTYSKNGIIIDSTGLPNNISFPLSALGYHDGKIEKETRLLMVVDKENANPLYFRYMAGNIVDVSTLKNTVRELELMGVTAELSLIDAGYCSEENIRLLYENKISFLTRLPAGRRLFDELIEKTVFSLQTPVNVVFYGDRALYVEKVSVVLYGVFEGFAYVCCDIARRADETVRCLRSSREAGGLSEVEVLERLGRCGLFVLLSSVDVATCEVLPLYYLRQSAEEIFKISKSYVDILPLRVHSEETFRGVLFLNFLSVVVYMNLQNQLPEGVSVECALKELRNLMCKVFDNNTILSLEPNKKQKNILNSIDNTVGKF